MSFIDDEDGDGLDLLAESVDDELVDDTIDPFRRNFLLSTDEISVSSVVNRLPDHAGLRGLADRAVRLDLLLGDKEAIIADLVHDIQSELTLLILEIKKDPARLVMSTIAAMPDSEAEPQIRRLMSMLERRLDNIKASGGATDKGTGGNPA